MRVLVLGQGTVGLALALRAVEVGHRVTGYDVDAERVSRLSASDPGSRDIAPQVLAAALAGADYLPTTDPTRCADFDVAVITVPTPLRDGVPDLSYVESAAHLVAPHIRPGVTVVLESTTYPGTTRERLVPILEKGSGLVAGDDFHVGYSPERIDPGNAQWGLANTPKIVSGLTPRSLAAVTQFYEGLVDQTVPVYEVEEAELAKLIENTFRHVNVALVNELAMTAHDLGIDIWKAIDAAASKPFGFMRFNPGPGVGGQCLPVDPLYLAWRAERTIGRSVRFVDLANDINGRMPDYVVQRLTAALNHGSRAVKGCRVLLLGLAFKKNTADAKGSPAVRVAHLLLGMGAEVRAADPHVHGDGVVPAAVTRVEPTPGEVAGADAVVLLTDHDAFDYELVARSARYVLDCRCRLPRLPNVDVL